MNQKIIDFLNNEQIQYCQNSQIKHHTSIKIGGKVKLLITIPSYHTLVKVLSHLGENKTHFILLGGGSNVIFTDKPCNFVVLLNRSKKILKLDNQSIQVDSGIPNSHLMKWCVENRAGDLEFLAGIPGTVGGAAAVNAGAFGQTMEEFVEKGEIFNADEGIRWMGNSFFNFSYRETKLKFSSHAILRLILKFKQRESEEILEKIRKNQDYRHANHPAYHRFTAGCFFKNPIHDGKKIAAGAILEEMGFKGYNHNQLLLSSQHANFLINKGKATFKDVTDLEKKIRDTVAEARNIQMNREVIYISATGEKY